ncbi:MAG: LCP family protein [Clostridia bacterium]|nr:LCP family protein [Clostridia bacterium]
MGREQNVNKRKHGVSDSKKRKKKREPTKKKKMNKVLKTILIILIVALITCCTIFGTYVYRAGGNFSEAFKSLVKDVVGDQDPIFVLVLGVSEDISAELTDTIMLVGYNPDNNQAFVLSIPRDTFIGQSEAKAGGYDKINALYQKSPEKTAEAVENLTGVEIDYYVTIKTSVLVQLVDSLGGVYFDVPINMDYDDPTQDLHIHLKAGYQKLNGNQAEHLVRFRHNNNGTTYSSSYGDNDEGRMRTQREFLKVVAQQVTQTKSVDQIKQITNAVFDNLETNITIGKALGYVPYAVDLNVNDLQMDQLPGTPEKINSLWFFRADKEKTRALIYGYIEKLGLSDAEKTRYLQEPEKKKTTTNNKSTEKNKSKNTNTTKKTTKKTTNTTKKTTNTNTPKKNTTNTTSKNEITNTEKNNTTNSITNTTPEKEKIVVTEKNESTSGIKPEENKNTTEPKPAEGQGNTSSGSNNTGGSSSIENKNGRALED